MFRITEQRNALYTLNFNNMVLIPNLTREQIDELHGQIVLEFALHLGGKIVSSFGDMTKEQLIAKAAEAA